jgi:hypothetical protein
MGESMPRRNRSGKQNIALKDKSQKWPEIIEMCEEKIARTELKTMQLRALLSGFRRQQAAGDPTPFEIAEHK